MKEIKELTGRSTQHPKMERYTWQVCVVMATLWMTSYVDTCSQPFGWRPQSNSERLDAAGLVILARIDSIGASVGSQIPVDVTVLCVLKNIDGAEVPGQLTLGQPSPPLCVDNIVNIRQGNISMIILRPTLMSGLGGMYTFSNINVQSAVLNLGDDALASRCDFRAASLPTSASDMAYCPRVKDDCNGIKTIDNSVSPAACSAINTFVVIIPIAVSGWLTQSFVG